MSFSKAGCCRRATSRVPRVRVLVAIAAVLIAGAAAADAPAIASLRYPADVGGNFVDANTYAARRDIVTDDRAGTRARVSLPGLPDTVDLRDFHVDPDGAILFALDTGAALGGTYFRPADVIRFSGTSFSKAFDATAAGVPQGVRCDGVARWGDSGTLLLSFDRLFTVGGTTVRPADVVVYAGGAFGAKLVDAKALGIPDTLNVDAIDTFRTRRYVLIAFDRAGTIGGVAFRASDILRLDLANGGWSLVYAPAAAAGRWRSARLDGLWAQNDDTIFDNELD